jgi:hypothetical protein
VKIQIVVRLGVSAMAVSCAALPAFLMPACLSSTAVNADGGGSSGGSSSGGSSGGSTSSSGGGGDAGGMSALLIDDMSQPATSTGGYWYTYSDRTCANTNPPLLMAGAPGMLSPLDGTQFNPAADSTGMAATVTIPGLPGPVGYREVSGGGERTWGAGFGFDLNDSPAAPNPFAKCMNTCTGTPPPANLTAGDGGLSLAVPFDASMYKGIQFYAKSLMATPTSPTKVDVHFATKQSDPAGGVCDPCKNGGAMACADDYIASVTIGADWAPVQALFAKPTKQSGWSGLTAAMDPSSVYYIHWQINGSTSAATPMFDIQIAYVTWVQ